MTLETDLDQKNNAVEDLANRVKKFYYYRALVCEKLIPKEKKFTNNIGDIKEITINNTDDIDSMPPNDYKPYENLSTDAYVIACVCIDGLSSIWASLNNYHYNNNQERFCDFLITVGANSDLERVCMPFLVYYMKKEESKKEFLNSLKEKELKELIETTEKDWKSEQKPYKPYNVSSNPTLEELKKQWKKILKINNQDEKKLDKKLKQLETILQKFTYVSLIYKYYRCAFIHEFRPSKYVHYFDSENKISVRFYPENNQPYLCIGIKLFTDSIRKGADMIYDLIIEKQCTDIPYAKDDEII